MSESLRTITHHSNAVPAMLNTAQVDFPTYLVFAFPSTPRPGNFNDAFGEYLEANSEVVFHEKMLFKKQAFLSQSGRQDPRISARNKLLVRRLEHEQLEKRLRRAELEKEVLSAELQASAKRVEEAQRLETATPPTPNSHEYPFPVAIYERPTLRDSYRDVQAPSIANGNIEG